MMGNLPICLIAWPNINEQIAAMQEVAAMRVPGKATLLEGLVVLCKPGVDDPIHVTGAEAERQVRKC
eukprot:CAMPEP_0175322458 /NCGR_PEP_ID=MMETSP0093-20121207/72484_1 /TAXON_ID=311494 /ORGANISM="Alexandrium monilatum, Strain CCMP3105" /LENGTH=66 /DNA_ID=CAMNT_0016619345 /DNA_START=369 /DNA_END=570 /DNA_ORIENTATION=+